ncbi:MAG: hypothetical protein CL927_16540 [Deltaproteobacteria bacterium]|nr:hypothetical protein [Deltaproteobacteria bacterium]HCH62465.1 hypothetical protein [Deltaproteobacteria bacterium]
MGVDLRSIARGLVPFEGPGAGACAAPFSTWVSAAWMRAGGFDGWWGTSCWECLPSEDWQHETFAETISRHPKAWSELEQ